MQDQGHYEDHFSGSPANDGTWHHIALTWQSSDGMTRLYDNGRQVITSPFHGARASQIEDGTCKLWVFSTCIVGFQIQSPD